MTKLLLMLTLAISCRAGEFAVLTTGFRLHADHHEFNGANVRLYQKDGGFSEISASLITSFEKELEGAVPASLAAPAAKTASAAPHPHALVEAAARKNGPPPKSVHSVVRPE